MERALEVRILVHFRAKIALSSAKNSVGKRVGGKSKDEKCLYHHFQAFPAMKRVLVPLRSRTQLPRAFRAASAAALSHSYWAAAALSISATAFFVRCRLFLFSVGLDPHVVQTWLIWCSFVVRMAS